VITGPGRAEVAEVAEPVAGPGEVVVDVERAGVCGTDVEFFTGEMAYLHTGEAAYPVRIGHEWCGTVSSIGAGVDPSWIGRRVTGDTMLGCGHCIRCTSGRQHLCANRYEIGIRGGWPGALADRLPVPVRALHPLPDAVDATLGALVEPGGNALRAVLAADPGPGKRVLITGPGAIGQLAAQFAAAAGAEVHLLGLSADLPFPRVWTADTLPDLPFDAVVDCSNAAGLPARAIELVEPGGRVVFIGIAGEPSLVDTRRIALKDLTVVGVLSASGGLADTISRYAAGTVDPRPLVAATVGLDSVPAVLSGARDPAWGKAPKIHIDPRS
jgi:threonine dehydrogenase-like Zn-dependent dehydrogenase